MTELNRKVAECIADNLIVDIAPRCRVSYGTVKAGAGTLKRGAVLARDEDGKLDIIGKGGKAYGILTDTIEVGDEDKPVTVYISGKFNRNKISVAEGYEMTIEDEDRLRSFGIEFTAAMEY
ncbi:MAG: head decoration protein [Firmicutes bacterium]|nr:head decoration protein [[Eubacterium] siraeum]MCM1486794.1 head decoration protein [Bacillota bacterium]